MIGMAISELLANFSPEMLIRVCADGKDEIETEVWRVMLSKLDACGHVALTPIAFFRNPLGYTKSGAASPAL